MTTKQDSLLEFPCDFCVKVMGKATPEFRAIIAPIFQKHVPEFSEKTVSERESKNGNYISLSIHINATSQEQLDNIYRELSASKWVLMTL